MSEKNDTLENAVIKVASAMLNTSMQNIDASTICGWANALGNACDQFRDVTKIATTTPTSKDSLVVGDMAAMREAFEEMLAWYNELHDDVAAMDAAMENARAALAKPPRNCDLYTDYGDALRAFEDDEDAESYEDIGEWLFAEAKGGE